jgi:hypothetical protein
MAILQHAQNLGETLGKVHLSSELYSSGVWKQATRLLIASALPGGHSSFEDQLSMHPDLLREFTRLLLYIPGLFAGVRSFKTGFDAWLADNKRKHSTFGSLLIRGPSKQEFEGFVTGAAENAKMWGHPKCKILALADSLIAKCDDPSLWLEAVVVSSGRLFAEYRQRGVDFFFHRSSYSYLGTTFSAQRSRWTASGYPFLPRVIYSLSALGTLLLLQHYVQA